MFAIVANIAGFQQCDRVQVIQIYHDFIILKNIPEFQFNDKKYRYPEK